MRSVIRWRRVASGGDSRDDRAQDALLALNSDGAQARRLFAFARDIRDSHVGPRIDSAPRSY